VLDFLKSEVGCDINFFKQRGEPPLPPPPPRSNDPDIRKSTAVCDGSQVSPTRPSDSNNTKLVNTTMVHLWNDTDTEKQNYLVCYLNHRMLQTAN